jgi:hypothetical protein
MPSQLACDPCNVSLSPAMHRRHLRSGHKLTLCAVCADPVLRRVPGCHYPNVCSPECRDLALKRGHCSSCFEPPRPDFVDGSCPSCSKKWALRATAFSYFDRQAQDVAEILASLDRAQWTPDAYHGTSAREALRCRSDAARRSA